MDLLINVITLEVVEIQEIIQIEFNYFTVGYVQN